MSKKSPAEIRRERLASRYGVTPEWFDEKLAAQGGCCALCLDTIVARPHVDHDHHTGKVRDILCMKCNTRLSAIEDEQFKLRAEEYLVRHGQELIFYSREPYGTSV